ncbi:MAG: radical SAM protein [Candidatus Omnitrophica bacterium]|nr:radical SAM protein [Candidatus Omnitrophota bacterium]
MKILFVDPLGDEVSPGLNMGIAYLTAILKEAGHCVSILDLNLLRDSVEERLRKAVQAISPDVVGFSVLNLSLKQTILLVNDLKKYYRGYIIAGGAEPSLQKENFFNFVDLNAIVVGEGEETLPEFLDVLSKGGNLDTVRGLIWKDKKNGKVRINPHRELIKDLDCLPMANYEAFGVESMDIYPIVTSRGCPHNCSFCSKYTSQSWRPRDLGKCLDELIYAKNRYGLKSFLVWDSCFNVYPKRIEEFCNLLVTNKIDLPWVAMGVRADKITEGMARALKKANCRTIWVGIESFDQEVLEAIGKGEDVEQIVKGIKIAKRSKLGIYGFMIMGLPKDTFKKTIKSLNVALSLNLDRLFYASAVPFTGTRLYEWVKNNGTFINDPFATSQILHKSKESVAFETKDFPKEERLKAKKIINIKTGFYENPGFPNWFFFFVKVYLILRHDLNNSIRRLVRSFKYRARKKTAIETIMEKRTIKFKHVPDGTWIFPSPKLEENVSSVEIYYRDLANEKIRKQ